MSLKYRDSTGTETPVAGLNGTSGELVPSVVLMQSGTAWFEAVSAGQYASKQITLDTPMPDTDYTVVVENSEYRYTVYVTSKTVNGFYIGVGNVTDEASITRGIKWTAFKLMTDEVHEADSAHIAQNTANFAPAFSDSVSYAVGAYVTYNNVLYRCTTAHTAGVWVAGHFTQVTVGDTLSALASSSASAIRQYIFENGNSVTLSMDSTAYRRICIYNATEYYEFVVYEWGAQPRYHWIVGNALPSTITASYGGYRLTLTSAATYRIVIETPNGGNAVVSYT